MAELRSVSSEDVKRQAIAVGFDLCGIAAAESYPELGFLQQWLDRGFDGEMHYMRRSAGRRADVRAVLPSARSIIALGTVYKVERVPPAKTNAGRRAAIACYAWGDDYHLIIERRLDALLAWLRGEAGDALDARRYVDTGPVQERVYARHAGLGWIGKNTCLINRGHGSWLFLSEIICNLPLEPDAPGLDHCGSCTRCLDACPTGALLEPYALDSRRCISYLTIELKGSIPVQMRPQLGAHAYGCDICQDVCPWNWVAPAPVSSDPAWQPRPGLDGAGLLELWQMSDEELRRLLKGSAMKRAGVRRLRRNLAVAIANSGDPAAIRALSESREPTSADPLVQEHVAWAIARAEAT